MSFWTSSFNPFILQASAKINLKKKKKSPYKKLKTTHVYQISWLLDVSLVYIYGDM